MDVWFTAVENEPLTLGQFRELTRDLSDTTPIVPRFVHPGAVRDHEPGVRLDALGFDDAGGVRTVALGVSLCYSDEVE